MGSGNICKYNLYLSSVFSLIFIVSTIYLLAKNKCKFNGKTLAILLCFFLTILLQQYAGFMAFYHSKTDADHDCLDDPLYVALIEQNDVLIYIIYVYLQLRMLKVYYRLKSVNKDSRKAKCAKFFSDYTIILIISLLLLTSAQVWVKFVNEYNTDNDEEKVSNRTIIFFDFISTLVFQLIAAIGILVFILLYLKFNKESKEF